MYIPWWMLALYFLTREPPAPKTAEALRDEAEAEAWREADLAKRRAESGQSLTSLYLSALASFLYLVGLLLCLAAMPVVLFFALCASHG